MIKAFPKYHRILLHCLLLAPLPLLAIEFKMPKDLADGEVADESQKEKDYGDKKYPLDGSGKPAGEGSGIVIVDPEAAEALEGAADETDFTEFPLLEAETEAAEEPLAEGEGRIVGQVFDKETGAPIRGVAIAVEGTDFGTITDEDGNFKLNKVPEGTYTLAYFKTGYLEANITDVVVESKEAKTLDFALPPLPAETSDDVYNMGTFTVTASEANDMMMKLELRMESDSILNVMSSEDFSKFAASDVGEAIKRVSGVTVQGGQFAVIRGLEERYSSTTFNGAPIPSPDPDRQSVPLDLFSSDIVNNLTITKTFEPSLPGNSSGGSIGIWTNIYPEELTIKFSAKTGFNENAQDEFLSNKRSLTSMSYAQARAEIEPGYSEELIYNTESAFTADIGGDRVTPKSENANLDHSLGLEIGGTKEFQNGKKARGLFTVSQKKKYRTARGEQERRFAAHSRYFFPSSSNYSNLIYRSDGSVREFSNRDIVSSDLVTESLSYSNGLYDQIISNEEEQINLLLSGEVDLDPDGTHVLGGNYFYTEKEQRIVNDLFNGTFTDTQDFTEDEARNSRGFVPLFTPLSTQFLQDVSEGTGFTETEVLNGSTYNTSTIALIDRELKVFQVNGRHNPNSGGLNVSWNYSRSFAEQTDSDVISLTSLRLPDDTLYAQLGTDSGDQFTPFVSYRRIEEDQEFARIDASYDWDLADDVVITPSTGLSLEDTERTSTLITYDLRISSSGGGRTEDAEETFQNNLDGKAFDNPAPVAAALGEREIDAYYLSTKLTYHKWDLVAGIRLEKFLLSTENIGQLNFFNDDVLIQSSSNPTNPNPVFNAQFLGINNGVPIDEDFEGKIDEDHYLPMFSLSRRFNEDWRAIFVYSETNARPSFKDFTYITSRDPRTLDYFIGNPALETSDVTNYDFRLEYVWNDGDLLSFGLFYKVIENPIERTTVLGSDAVTEVMYNNPDNASIKGLEFEVRKNLGFLSDGLFEYFSVGSNFTIIDGQIKILPAMEDIFNGGFTFIDPNGNERTTGEDFNVESGDTSASGSPEFIGAPYTERQLFQQPEWIVNADISFDNPSWGTRVALSLFAQSDVLDSAEGYLLGSDLIVPSIYQKSFYELNFTYSQNLGFWLEGLEFSLQIKNLTDSERNFVYGDEFGGGNDTTLKIGRTYSVGLNYVF